MCVHALFPKLVLGAVKETKQSKLFPQTPKQHPKKRKKDQQREKERTRKREGEFGFGDSNNKKGIFNLYFKNRELRTPHALPDSCRIDVNAMFYYPSSYIYGVFFFFLTLVTISGGGYRGGKKYYATLGQFKLPGTDETIGVTAKMLFWCSSFGS